MGCANSIFNNNNNCVWLVIILVIIFCFGGFGCGVVD